MKQATPEGSLMLAVQMSDMKLGNALRILREAHALKPEDIEARLKDSGHKTTGRTIYNIETKDNLPSLSTFKGMAAAFGISLSAFLVELAGVLDAGQRQAPELSADALMLAHIHDALNPHHQKLLMETGQHFRQLERQEVEQSST